MKKLLFITSVAEIIVGILFLIFTETFIGWFLNVESDAGTTTGFRFVGIALIGFGIACIPAKDFSERYIKIPAVRAMLAYNLFATIFFFYLKMATSFDGILLLPAAIIHLIITILYVVFVLKQN